MPESKPMSESNEKPYSPGIGAIFEVVARLRAPDGCPWDREQTHESLRPYLLEETYELLEAIDSKDDAKMYTIKGIFGFGHLVCMARMVTPLLI